MPRKIRLALLALIILLTTGCSFYQYKVKGARQALRARNYDKALADLKPRALEESRDQLVYLLDYALVLQYAGRYEESNTYFQMADQLSEVKDYHSITRITGSLLLSEDMVQYKGEDFEKVYINAFGAINYLMLGNLESALVEARRLNEKLRLYKDEAKRDYTQSPFARYLAAMAWEADRKYDDAYIDYEKAYELNPAIPGIGRDLIRAAIRAQRPDKVKKWKSEFGDVELGEGWQNPEYGELVLVYQKGWGPRKRPHPSWPRIPKLFPTAYFTKGAELQVGEKSYRTQSLESVQEVAIKTMEEAYAGLIAKRVAGKVVKHQVAKQIHKKNEGLGNLAYIAMSIADQADLRQWSILPAEFQIARAYLPAGEYQVKVQGLTAQGLPSGEFSDYQVTIHPSQKTFMNWRSMK